MVVVMQVQTLLSTALSYFAKAGWTPYHALLHHRRILPGSKRHPVYFRGVALGEQFAEYHCQGPKCGATIRYAPSSDSQSESHPRLCLKCSAQGIIPTVYTLPHADCPDQGYWLFDVAFKSTGSELRVILGLICATSPPRSRWLGRSRKSPKPARESTSAQSYSKDHACSHFYFETPLSENPFVEDARCPVQGCKSPKVRVYLSQWDMGGRPEWYENVDTAVCKAKRTIHYIFKPLAETIWLIKRDHPVIGEIRTRCIEQVVKDKAFCVIPRRGWQESLRDILERSGRGSRNNVLFQNFKWYLSNLVDADQEMLDFTLRKPIPIDRCIQHHVSRLLDRVFYWIAAPELVKDYDLEIILESDATKNSLEFWSTFLDAEPGVNPENIGFIAMPQYPQFDTMDMVPNPAAIYEHGAIIDGRAATSTSW